MEKMHSYVSVASHPEVFVPDIRDWGQWVTPLGLFRPGFVFLVTFSPKTIEIQTNIEA